MRFTLVLYAILILLYIYSLPYFAYMLLTALAALLRPRAGCSTGLLSRPQKPPERRFMLVIPAHDEEAIIADTVNSCRTIRYPSSLFEIMVIADNCTDGTTARAREAGARVLERHDPTKRGKGHALEYMIGTLQESNEFDAIDALVVVDADTTVHPDLLARLREDLDHGFEWIQCYNTVGNGDQSWRTRLVAYAFSLFNGVTLMGQSALGLSVGLRGNGMCLSTKGLRRVPWKAHGLAEDLEYSWAVRIQGGQISFARDVAVYSVMLAEGGKPMVEQRRRWEFGRSLLRRTMLVPLLKSTRISLVQKVAATIELTALTTINLICMYVIISVLFFDLVPDMIRNHHYILICVIGAVHAVSTLAVTTYGLSPFLLSLIPWRFARALVYLPYYAVWKLFVRAHGRPNEWLRTPREKKKCESTSFTAGSKFSQYAQKIQRPADSEFSLPVTK
jgi:1,2-diacylglycerol 3-beta-glucosyltransferase